MRNWKRTSIFLSLILLSAILAYWLTRDKASDGYVAVFEYSLQTADPIAFELNLKALSDIQIEVFGPVEQTVVPLRENETMDIYVERASGLLTCKLNYETVSNDGISDDDSIGNPWVKSGDLIYWVEGEDRVSSAGIRITEAR